MFAYIIIVIAFGADRLSKWWAADFLARNGPTEIHPLLAIREGYNEGIAFGLFQGIGPYVGWLSILVVIGLALYMGRLPAGFWLVRAGLAFVIGGALGNLVDRVWHGRVLDFLSTPLRSGIFNVADVMIYLGLFLCFAGLFWSRERPPADLPPFDPEGF